MTKTEELYALAEEWGYPVLEPPPDGTIESMAILSPRGTPCVFLREDGHTAAELNERLAHELGHCRTGAFYTALSAPAARGKCEEQARRWSYRQMIPLEALIDGLRRGLREPYEFSEWLEVPQGMVAEAVAYYRAAFSGLAGNKNRPSPGGKQERVRAD